MFPAAWRGIRNAVGTTALRNAEARDIAHSSFPTWLPKGTIHILVGRRHGRWYAVARDFSVASGGESEQAARDSLSVLLEDYFRTFYEQGRSFDEARRPLPVLTRLRLFLPLKPRRRQQLRYSVH